MNKDFVPHEEALALKELGFDEPCFTRFEGYFNKTKLHPILATLYLNTPYENEYNGYNQKIINDSSKRWFFTGYKNSVKDHNNDILSAPTFSQAFRWFREEHNLRGSIMDFIDDEKNIDYDYEIAVLGTDVDEFGAYVPMISYSIDDKTRKFKTYEDAELGCIRKLIEIVKSKK